MTPLAVVTGAAGGIGAATCALLRARGWRVIGIDRQDATDTFVADEMLTVDLADAGAVQDAFAMLGSHERIDALVNNAAIQVTKSLVDTDPIEWDHVMAVNVRAPYLSLRATAPSLAAARGSVVNIASVHASATSPGIAAYAASKGALVALTRAAALELAPLGIRVNAVLPGATETPMLRAGLKRTSVRGRDAGEALATRTPLSRIGEPADVAEMIAFLAEPERSSFVTGQTFVVDGGALARLSTE